MKEKYSAYSNKVRQVTRMPGAFLKIKGKMDSRKGAGVCDETIHRWERKLAALESKEAIQAENRLFKPRKEASVILVRLYELEKVQKEFPDNIRNGTVESIRLQRKNTAKKMAAVVEVHNILQKLTVLIIISLMAVNILQKLTAINEMIINTDLILDERINKMRRGLEEKQYAYLSGIRAGKLKDYHYERKNEDDTARELYHNRHKELDVKIAKAIKLTGEEDVA